MRVSDAKLGFKIMKLSAALALLSQCHERQTKAERANFFKPLYVEARRVLGPTADRTRVEPCHRANARRNHGLQTFSCPGRRFGRGASGADIQKPRVGACVVSKF